jgi:hypothetical protein
MNGPNEQNNNMAWPAGIIAGLGITVSLACLISGYKTMALIAVFVGLAIGSYIFIRG